MEKVYANKIDEHLGELAFHFLESGDKDKALDYFLKAGEKAVEVHANREAISYFQSALALLEGREDKLREKGHVLESLGDTNSILAEYKNSMGFFNEALLLWKQLGEKRRAADVHRRIAGIVWRMDGNVEKATEHFGEALKILATEPESVELARLHLGLGGMYFQTGDLTKAFASAEKALELSKRIEQFNTMARSYSLLGAVFIARGEIRKSYECLEKALKISLDNNYAEYALNAYNNLAVSLPTEENERRLEYLEKAYELAKKAGIIGSISWQGCALASVYAFAGDTKKALLLAEESVALDKRANALFNLSFTNVILGFVYQVLGEWDRSEQCYKEALTNSEKTHSYQAAWMCYGGLGSLHYDMGEYVQARAFFEKMYDVLGKVGAKMPPMHQVIFASVIASTYTELGEFEKAKNAIDMMYESARPMNDKGLIATADALRAVQLREEKKWQEAIELLEKSLKEFEALEWRRWMSYHFASVLDECAQTYLKRDQKGDREKARDLLNQALETFQKMDAKKDVEKVEARISFLETGRVVSKPKLMGQVSTGHADLDKLLCGGIPSGFAVVLTSVSCNERDLLIRSFLETGAKKSEATFHVTIDLGIAKPLAEEFPSNFYLFICNPQADAIAIEAPNVFKLKGVENLTDISIALTSAVRKLAPSVKARRICIGLTSDVLLQHHAVQTRRWLTALITELKSTGFTILATINPEIHPSQELQAILDLFEGEISIYEKETEKGTGRYLRVKKMGNRKYMEDEMLLKREQA